MITGDFPQTGAAIARAAGIAAAPRVVSGEELSSWDDATLAARLREFDVVARAKPLVKLRLVQALQGAGEVVAMTGDGVNDAPALRAAHIGVAMGERGSDVAREAASLVLLRDDFGSLVAAVRRGRRIFANLRQALLYVLAVHVPMIGAGVLPLLIGAPPLLLPLHVMFLEFVIDPACSLAFEAERSGRDPMSAPPRPAGEHVLGARGVMIALVQGLIAFSAAAGTYALARLDGAGEALLRTATVSTMVAMNLVLIVHDRSSERSLLARLRAPNPALWFVVALTCAAWAAVLALPMLRALFKLDAPTWAMLGWILPSLLLAGAALEAWGRWSAPADTPARVRFE
jgi:Ca2+-transporting ATPase